MTSHILWNYRITTEVWKELGIKLPNGYYPQVEFIDIVWKLREVPNEVDWELFATIAWALWNNRNSFKHEGRCKQAKSIARDLAKYVEEFRQSSMPTTIPTQPYLIRTPWRPLRLEWYKVNVDGTVFKDSGYCGIEEVIRNEKGQLLGAIRKKLPLLLGALEVEAKAVEEGILLSRDLGLREVIVEGDAMIVMTALSSPNPPPSSIHKVMEGSKRCLQVFKAWEVNHVCRCNNVAVHLMARHASFVSDCVL